MKNLFSHLLITSLIVTGTTLVDAADKSPVIKKQPVQQTAKAKEEAQEAGANSVITNVLNQVISAKIEVNFDIGSKRTKVAGVDKTLPDIKFLEVHGLLKFKDDIKHNFVQEGKTENQLKKVVPNIRFTTKDMIVVLKGRLEKKGNLKVRFCQSYSIQNDFCNTADDTKLLEINVRSPNFEMFDLKLKDINVDFDQQISEGKFSFKGTCTALKNAIDYSSPDKALMRPAECSFYGEYDSKAAGDKFVAYGMKFKTKVP